MRNSSQYFEMLAVSLHTQFNGLVSFKKGLFSIEIAKQGLSKNLNALFSRGKRVLPVLSKNLACEKA